MAISQPIYRADLSYSESITADELTVKFDGVLYQVKKDARGGYGNSGLGSNASASGLPFYIVRGDGVNGVFTKSAGQHTIEISENTSKVETTECFKKAVKSVGSGVMMLHFIDGNIEGATWQEAYDAIQNGTMVYLKDDRGLYPCSSVDSAEIIFALINVRDGTSVTAYVYIWESDGTVEYQESIYPSQS